MLTYRLDDGRTVDVIFTRDFVSPMMVRHRGALYIVYYALKTMVDAQNQMQDDFLNFRNVQLEDALRGNMASVSSVSLNLFGVPHHYRRTLQIRYEPLVTILTHDRVHSATFRLIAIEDRRAPLPRQPGYRLGRVRAHPTQERLEP